MRTALLFVVLCGACIQTYPTPAIVARMVRPTSDTPQLTACTVNMNWTEADLRDNCGAPDQVVAWTGHASGRCALYRTAARSFAVGMGVEVVAACMQPQPHSTQPTMRVVEIVGLESSILPAR